MVSFIYVAAFHTYATKTTGFDVLLGCGNEKIQIDFRGFNVYTKNKTEMGECQ